MDAAAMPEHEIDYRGYKIEVKPNDQGWVVNVAPKTPELPILRWNSFRAPLGSQQDAVAEARRRVDRLLSIR
jgi:hypothetical protein